MSSGLNYRFTAQQTIKKQALCQDLTPMVARKDKAHKRMKAQAKRGTRAAPGQKKVFTYLTKHDPCDVFSG